MKEPCFFSGVITINLDPSREYHDIQEMVNVWRAISLIDIASKEGLDVEIGREGVSPVRIGFFDSGKVPEIYKIIAEAVENAWYLVQILDLPVNLRPTLRQIVDQKQILVDLRIFLNPTDPSIRSITGSLFKPADYPEKEYAIVITRMLKLGDMTVFIAIGVAGLIILDEKGTEFEIMRPKRVSVEHFIMSENDKLHDAYETVYNHLDKKGYEIIKQHDDSSDEEEY